MKNNLVTGLLVGAVFCVAVVWGAVAGALSAGGTVLLAVGVDTLMAGLAVGGLIAANFALRESDEQSEQKMPARAAHAAT
jgi:uncharacterized membrane protein (DUF441 family)